AAQRPLGRDVDRVGPGRVEQLCDALARPPGELDLAVARTGKAPEGRRLDRHDLVTAGPQALLQLQQRRDHAIDLRQPGIGDQGDLHAASISTGATGNAATLLPERDARPDQSMTSSRPSACSTSALRLSTQSPSLA